MNRAKRSAPGRGAPARLEHKVQIATSRDRRARSRRETVESIVVAVILAFLFRTFVAEAFVIPTGSMAPTLMGRHNDVVCSECGCRYRSGASCENREGGGPTGLVTATTCPICRYPMTLDLSNDPNQESFTGDRILVSKFSYQLGEPDRWDVIVFKFPGNAKQNYIKRLVGLPNETVRIHCGDVFIRKEGEKEFHIARKPERKLLATLQPVDDTRYLAKSLVDVGWPSRWQRWSPADGDSASLRRIGDDKDGIELEAPSGSEQWVRYRHLIPSREEWEGIENGDIQKADLPERIEEWGGQLITDFYAYNAFSWIPRHRSFYTAGRAEGPTLKSRGLHWVGDLACECDVETASEAGELILDLVEGGVHHQCRIDLATGKAVLSIDGGVGVFSGEDGRTARSPESMTAVRGGGRYRLRFSNVDDELRLWVDDELAEFDGPTTYAAAEGARPRWRRRAPGDLAPVGVGASGAELTVQRLRVLRDVYYAAVRSDGAALGGPSDDYDAQSNGFNVGFDERRILEILSDPRQWESTPLFDSRRSVEFALGSDEFFPLGDNSPQSKDARLWEADPHVDRDLLTGKALLVYWPHAWRRPIPLWPNWRRMKLIR